MKDSPDGEANVQIRGVGPRVLAVREQVKIVEGRFFTPGLPEVVVGRGARNAYQGLDLGSTVRLGAGTWTVVGILDAGGSAFDSEVWADATILNGLYQRPPNVYQAATVKLRSPDDFEAFEERKHLDDRGARRRAHPAPGTPLASRHTSTRRPRVRPMASPGRRASSSLRCALLEPVELGVRIGRVAG